MIIARACKASSTVHMEPIESVALIIQDEIPEIRVGDNSIVKWQKAMDDFYSTEATKIMSVIKHLPQGTVHQLLIQLLEYKKCYLMVR